MVDRYPASFIQLSWRLADYFAPNVSIGMNLASAYFNSGYNVRTIRRRQTAKSQGARSGIGRPLGLAHGSAAGAGGGAARGRRLAHVRVVVLGMDQARNPTTPMRRIIPFLSVSDALAPARGAPGRAQGARRCLALGLLIPALALLVLATKTELEAVESFSFLLAITSGVWLLFGTKVLRAAAFPLAFLWLMAPLPGPVLNDATLHIQMLSTVLADKLLHLMTFHTVLQGNVIHMDDFSLFVDVPCSGFHLLLSLMTVSAAFAYLIDGAPKKRLGLFLLSLPLSLAVNSVRIALIGVVGECLGTSAAHTFHDWSGALTLMLGVAVLFISAKGLGCRTFAGWPLF